jgi:hypothetical protein
MTINGKKSFEAFYKSNLPKVIVFVGQSLVQIELRPGEGLSAGKRGTDKTQDSEGIARPPISGSTGQVSLSFREMTLRGKDKAGWNRERQHQRVIK